MHSRLALFSFLIFSQSLQGVYIGHRDDIDGTASRKIVIDFRKTDTIKKSRKFKIDREYIDSVDLRGMPNPRCHIIGDRMHMTGVDIIRMDESEKKLSDISNEIDSRIQVALGRQVSLDNVEIIFRNLRNETHFNMTCDIVRKLQSCLWFPSVAIAASEEAKAGPAVAAGFPAGLRSSFDLSVELTALNQDLQQHVFNVPDKYWADDAGYFTSDDE